MSVPFGRRRARAPVAPAQHLDADRAGASSRCRRRGSRIERQMVELFFDRVPFGLAVFDLDGRLQRCNRTWIGFYEHYFGAGPDYTAPGRHLDDLIPGNEEAVAELFAAVRGGQVVRQAAQPDHDPRPRRPTGTWCSPRCSRTARSSACWTSSPTRPTGCCRPTPGGPDPRVHVGVERDDRRPAAGLDAGHDPRADPADHVGHRREPGDLAGGADGQDDALTVAADAGFGPGYADALQRDVRVRRGGPPGRRRRRRPVDLRRGAAHDGARRPAVRAGAPVLVAAHARLGGPRRAARWCRAGRSSASSTCTSPPARGSRPTTRTTCVRWPTRRRSRSQNSRARWPRRRRPPAWRSGNGSPASCTTRSARRCSR